MQICAAVLIFALLTCLVTANKTLNTITLAFVGPYAHFPGVAINGTLVVGDFITGARILEFNQAANLASVFFWNDVGAQIAVDAVNRNPDLLPNTTIVVKRFNDLDLRYPIKQLGNSKVIESGGYAVQVAIDIAQNHPDVVAVFGDLFSQTTLLTGELYSLFKMPFCTAFQAARNFLNRNDYSNYFSMVPNAGYGQAMCLLLNLWNTKRIAYITIDGSMKREFEKCNVRVVLLSRITHDTSIKDIEEIGRLLQYYDLRYIVIDVGSVLSGFVYFTLASKGVSVGPGYVWVGNCLPYPIEDGAELLGPSYSPSHIRHFMFLFKDSPFQEYKAGLFRIFLESINRWLAPLNTSIGDDALHSHNGIKAFDCIGVLSHGIDKLMRKFPAVNFNSREDRSILNYAAFQDTGYFGFTGSPLKMSDSGDPAIPFMALQIDEFYNVYRFATTDVSISHIEYLEDEGMPLFAGNTSNPPPDGPIYASAVLNMSSYGGKFLIFLSVSGWFVCLLDTLLILAFRRRKYVGSNSRFNLTTNIGGAIGFSGAIFCLGGTTALTCAAIMWTSCLAFAIVASSVAVKCARVGILFDSKFRLPAIFINDLFAMAAVGALVSLELILLAIWSKVSNPVISFIQESGIIEHKCVISKAGTTLNLMITGYHIALILFSAYATYLIRNVDGIHSDFSYLALVLATLCILALTEVLFNQHSTSPLSKRVLHEFFTWLILMGVVGVKCFTRVYALWNDSRASSRLKQLSVLSIPILQRLLSGEEKNTRTALQPSEQFREEAQKAMGSALGQLKSNYYYGKTTCVVYRVDRVGAKWIPALCVSCFERRNAFILLIPCDPGNRAVGMCLEAKECLKVIQKSSLPFRLSAKNRLQNKALLIDFHSKERGMALLQNLLKNIGDQSTK